MSASLSGYSQLSQEDALLDENALPPSYSNPFHNPRAVAPYPPMAPPSFTQLPTVLSTFHPLPAPSATNHLAITHKHTAIRGTYCIDTSIVVPTHLLDPVPNSLWTVLAGALGAGGDSTPRERPNAAFATEIGQIDLVLHVRGGGRASINIEQKNGGSPVRVAIASLEPNTSLSLTVNSKSTVLISLPSSFRGLIKGGSEGGTLTFSEALKPQTATFSVDQQSPLAGRYFIGDWREAVAASSQGVSAAWSGTSTSLGAEDRKGPLLEYECSTTESTRDSSGCFSGSASSGATAASSSSNSPPAQAPWMGDVVTVTSHLGSITIETMEERSDRIHKRNKSWGTSVWSALGGCCGSVGVLTMACFGCPAH